MKILERGWIGRIRKLPRVQRRQAHRVSKLAYDLARELAPGIRPGRTGSTPLEIAAYDLALYLYGNWEFRPENDPAPRPQRWDNDQARNVLEKAMSAFEASAAISPRGPGNEIQVRKLAYELAIALLEAGTMKDPYGLMDRVIQGRISEISMVILTFGHHERETGK